MKKTRAVDEYQILLRKGDKTLFNFQLVPSQIAEIVAILTKILFPKNKNEGKKDLTTPDK